MNSRKTQNQTHRLNKIAPREDSGPESEGKPANLTHPGTTKMTSFNQINPEFQPEVETIMSNIAKMPKKSAKALQRKKLKTTKKISQNHPKNIQDSESTHLLKRS